MNQPCDNQRSDNQVLRTLMVLFVMFTVVALLAGHSRMSPPAWQLRTFGDVLRIREALSMFVFAPAIGVLFWLILQCIGRGRVSTPVQILMVIAIYFTACGMGIHDPCNRLQTAYRSIEIPREVWASWVYLDDALGHWVFFVGFVSASWLTGIQQLLTPLEKAMQWQWRIFFLVIALVLSGVMLTNLWDEYPKTLMDLCVIAIAVLVPLLLHLICQRRLSIWRLPLLLIIYPAYIISIAGTLLRWKLQHQI